MLEEKGGWISREAPKLDIEMQDAVIELLAEASQNTSPRMSSTLLGLIFVRYSQ
jgi:hypothetical protein